MLPDAPTTCPICGAAMSHDSQHYQALRLTARVFECGGAVCIADGGHLYPALACPKSSAIIAELRAENARLRADNVRVGDRGVLLAIATQGAIEGLEAALGRLATKPVDMLPDAAFLRTSPIRAAYDELVDALEGAAPTPAADTPANETCPGQSEGVTAAEHVGDPARSS